MSLEASATQLVSSLILTPGAGDTQILRRPRQELRERVVQSINPITRQAGTTGTNAVGCSICTLHCTAGSASPVRHFLYRPISMTERDLRPSRMVRRGGRRPLPRPGGTRRVRGNPTAVRDIGSGQRGATLHLPRGVARTDDTCGPLPSTSAQHRSTLQARELQTTVP